MDAGLRCAGVVEFGGLKAPASQGPLDLLRKQVRQTFPGFEAAEEIPWLGHRPAPSDSLPLIGEVGKTGVLTGFGHHHIGLTAGPKTGRILAGLISGQTPNIDLSVYNPSRF
jgi:D-amino-acid dehydrogenase